MDSLEAVRVFLQASPDELRAVLDLAPIGIVVLRGPELVYEYVNPAFQSLAPTVQLIGRRFGDASWELPDVLVKLKEVWETGQPWRVTDYMIPIERHPGAPLEQASFTVSCTRVGRRDASDALVGFVYETTDRVDAMERATSAMAEAERRTDELETIIATMLEGVLVIDRGRKVTLVNPAARRMLADFSGMEVHDREQAQRALREIDGRYLDGRPVENHMIPVARALAGEACRSTFRFRNPIDRHTIYASIGAAPIRNQEGEVVGAVSVGSDVTEEIELDRLKDEFIRQIAHEVKTPITIMKGCASILLRALGPSLAPPHARLLDAVSRGADRINRIMCELLDAQQIDLGRFEMVEEQVELNELLQDMTDRAAAMSPKHRIRFAEGRPVAIVADAERLREVMRILLDNAVRYSPGGGDVDVKLRASDGEVVIAVRDQGVGIPVDRRARLFQRFYRAHAGTQHDYGGTGLGLYVARTIVERHGGSIRFESEEGRGTTFTIRLPRRTPDGQA